MPPPPPSSSFWHGMCGRLGASPSFHFWHGPDFFIWLLPYRVLLCQRGKSLFWHSLCCYDGQTDTLLLLSPPATYATCVCKKRSNRTVAVLLCQEREKSLHLRPPPPSFPGQSGKKRLFLVCAPLTVSLLLYLGEDESGEKGCCAKKICASILFLCAIPDIFISTCHVKTALPSPLLCGEQHATKCSSNNAACEKENPLLLPFSWFDPEQSGEKKERRGGVRPGLRVF